MVVIGGYWRLKHGKIMYYSYRHTGVELRESRLSTTAKLQKNASIYCSAEGNKVLSRSCSEVS